MDVTPGRFVGPCCHCGSQMWLPETLYDAAKRTDRITFYCPYGHPQVFTQGESEETKLRRERDRLVQQMARKDEEIKWHCDRAMQAMKDVAASKRQVSKLTQRASKGVCACCNRTFVNVARHMKTKHPDFKAVRVA